MITQAIKIIVVRIIDKADFNKVLSTKAFTNTTEADKWADKKCDEYKAMAEYDGTLLYVTQYDCELEEMELRL